MEHTAEVLETQGDYSLIRWSGRKFPGLLMQGDTLSILVSDARELEELIDAGDLEEARAAAHELLRSLSVMQRSYEEMMKLAGVKLPYAPHS
ncbi:DUF6959 family protein [Nocardia coubleae]|uniref:Uncharacterized protein n=1 Tax=Nocardia coubleae TaxID=356147 RepID=A0A846W5W7_9NOCA|nr:hypothetical protein [Nocardia coubleae]NKX88017.1 hypothetical protein [Nocardia coubleae]